jgi:MYXO-CTERM domain-containing protein
LSKLVKKGHVDILERMKTRLQKTRTVTIPRSRWLGYVAAGAATALAGATSAEAEIHYSGRVFAKFEADENKVATFPLDQPGDVIRFGHYTAVTPYGFFEIEGKHSEAFVGYSLFEYAFPFRLQRSPVHYVSEGEFASFYNHGTLYDVNGRGYGKWGGRVTGFVGFRFDSGAGVQYGWARVRMGGHDADFILLDYAYADPGEPIKPGQTSSSEANTPSEGSLGLLAVGAAGLALWRRRRKAVAA